MGGAAPLAARCRLACAGPSRCGPGSAPCGQLAGAVWLLPRPAGPVQRPGAGRSRRPPGATNGVPDLLVGPAMRASLLDGGHEHLAIELRPHARHDLGVEQRVGLGLALELVPLAPPLGLGPAARRLPAWPTAAREAAGGGHPCPPQPLAPSP